MIANFQVRLHIMSYVIAIFVRVGEWGFIEFPGGRVVKKRESPDFRSPEVGISEIDPFFFSSFNPCRSSTIIHDNWLWEQFQCLNVVLNDKTESLFLEFNWCTHKYFANTWLFSEPWVSLSLWFAVKAAGSQPAKKVVSDSPGLVDFSIGLVNSVFNLPNGQVIFFEEFE